MCIRIEQALCCKCTKLKRKRQVQNANDSIRIECVDAGQKAMIVNMNFNYMNPMNIEHIKMWRIERERSVQLEFKPLWPQHLCIWLSKSTRVWNQKWVYVNADGLCATAFLHDFKFISWVLLSLKFRFIFLTTRNKLNAKCVYRMGAKKHLWSTFNSFLCKVMDCVEWEVVDVSDVYNRWKDLCVWHKIGDVAWIIAFIWYSIVCTFDVFSFLRVKTFDSLNVDDHQRIFKCMNSVFARLFSLTFDLRYH